MVSIYELKPKFQQLLRPIVKRLAAKGISANQVTIFAMVLSILMGTFLSIYQNAFIFLLVPFIMFIRMALNAIDGMLAREYHMKSPLGTILNEIGDVVSDTALFLPFAFIESINPFLLVGVILVSIISEMTGVLGQVIGASRRYDGPIGKSDRAFIFSVLSLLIGFGISISTWVNWFLVLIIVLIIVNCIIRIKRAISEVK